MYRFESLNRQNKDIWLKTADECDYAPVNALDPSLIEAQIENGSAASAILYEGDEAVALFQGELAVKRIGPISLRLIQSRFGGLLVRQRYLSHASSLKDFMIKEVIDPYYSKRLKADYMELVLPPKLMIEQSSLARTFLPFDKSDVGINSILYTRLDNDLLDRFDYNVKREIKKGLDHISGLEVTEGRGRGVLSHIAELEAEKAKRLKIKAIPTTYFERLLSSPFYQVRVAVRNGRPLSAVIYTLWKDISTFNYNASSEEGKRYFINKALLYLSMQHCFRNGAQYFVLGNGREYSKSADEDKQLKNMTFFKRRFSTDETAQFIFRHALTKRGALVLAVNRVIGRCICGERWQRSA